MKMKFGREIITEHEMLAKNYFFFEMARLRRSKEIDLFESP